MEKGKKIIKHVFLLTVLILVTSGLAFAGGAQEKTEKSRLNVGWTAGESLESTIIDENWQYLEMGCMIWQICYDQVWIMGDADSGYAAEPMVAKSWEVSEDMKTWTFYLRDDIKFHDGQPLTAEDLAFTLEYLPASDPAWQLVDLDYESFEVIDDYTFKVTMNSTFGMPYPPLYWMPILPKHIWEPYKDDMKSYDNPNLLGSGPYKVKEFKQGQYVWLDANTDYWGGMPGLDEIVFKVYGTEDAKQMALRTGDIDMVGYLGVNPITLNDFKKVKDIEIITAPDINLYWLSFNMHQENGMQDLEVRKAIMHAIDVDRIIDMALLGYGEPADSFVYPELEWYNDDITRYSYDPKKAAAILDAAGYADTDGDGIRNEKNGENMVYEIMVGADYSAEIKASRLIKEMLAEVGIGIEQKIVDLDTYYYYIYAPEEDKFDMAFAYEGPGPNGEWSWDICRGWSNGGAGWNTAYYNSSEFDTALDNMLSAVTFEDKNVYRKEMQKIISDDIPYGLLYRKNVVCPVNTSKITGYTATMGGTAVWINPWSFLRATSK